MCTRALYQGADSLVITGRTMDWVEDMHSNAWLFPRGTARDGAAKSDSLRWTSKYGSVGISGYESGIADGMNEEGPGGKSAVPGRIGLRHAEERQADDFDSHLGAVCAGQLCER